MNTLVILFSIFTLSVFGMVSTLVFRSRRIQKEKDIQMKIAIQNSEKIKKQESEELTKQNKTTPEETKNQEKTESEIREIGEKTEEEKKKEANKNEGITTSAQKVERNTGESEKLVSEKDILTLIGKADLHTSRKEFAEAEKILIEVLSFNSHNIPALEKLGNIYLEMEYFSKAKIIYEQLIEEFPKNPNVHTNYALSLFYEKEFEKAIEEYEVAKTLDPQNAVRYANLGQIFFAVKNYPLAIEYFAESIKLEPRNQEYLFLLADTFKVSKRFAEAKKWYEKILDISPYDADAKKEIEKFEALGF
jgi:tetratricopeptide (TPR) repeat protein